MKNSAVIIFVRFPQAGKVKTRLAAKIGNTKAANIYKLLAENVVQNVKKVVEADTYIFFSDENELEETKIWLGSNFIYCRQDGKDLGTRMKNAFKKVFEKEYDKVLIIGSDVPDLSSIIIEKAINLLNKHDCVIGPSIDGGFYLLGMKNYHPKIFDKVEYSTNNVYSRTLENMKSLNLTFTALPILLDIDTEGDLNKWLNKNSTDLAQRIVEL